MTAADEQQSSRFVVDREVEADDRRGRAQNPVTNSDRAVDVRRVVQCARDDEATGSISNELHSGRWQSVVAHFYRQ